MVKARFATLHFALLINLFFSCFRLHLVQLQQCVTTYQKVGKIFGLLVVWINYHLATLSKAWHPNGSGFSSQLDNCLSLNANCCQVLDSNVPKFVFAVIAKIKQ